MVDWLNKNTHTGKRNRDHKHKDRTSRFYEVLHLLPAFVPVTHTNVRT